MVAVAVGVAVVVGVAVAVVVAVAVAVAVGVAVGLTTKGWKMSNLVKHAEREMKLAGLYDQDADYAGMIPEAVMKLVKVHSEEGHSGGSHGLTLEIFNRVINFKTLTPISSNPDEWMEIQDGKVWQNNRQGSVFSQDAGKTWYDIDDPKKTNWPNRTEP